jgi:putative phage-type endonuclease
VNREAWLKERQTGVGSSDAPNLVGVGFRRALDVYHEKTEAVDARLPAGGFLRRGIDLEPLVARKYEEAMGVALVVPAATRGGELLPADEYLASVHRHPDRPWQTCSPDRRRADDGRPVEMKTTLGFGDAWGEPGTGDVPEGYRVQCQHQLGVTGDRYLDLAALDLVSWELRVYRLEADPEFFRWLTQVEAEFYLNFVVPRQPPPPDWQDQFLPKIAERTAPSGKVELGADIAELLDRRAAVKRVMDDAEAEVKRLTAEVESALGGHAAGIAGPWKLKRVFVQGGRVEYDRKPYYRLDARKPRGDE